MPLIAPEKKTNNESLTVTLPVDTIVDLRAYAKFLNDSSPAYVLTQLIFTLVKDKEFQQWKASKHLHTLPEESQVRSNGAGKVRQARSAWNDDVPLGSTSA